MEKTSQELPGLKVILDRLVYHQDPELPEGKEHAFIYFITIRNLSDREVNLLGRKWIIQHADGKLEVFEGDKIVGECPQIAPGNTFSYNSYHITRQNAVASGSFHGLDEFNNPIHVTIPEFALNIPE